MTRRRALDWALVVLLTASWGVLFARALVEGVRNERGKLRVGASSAAGADTYPVVKPSLWLGGAVQPGDEVVAVDGESLRGSSALHFYDLATRSAREHGQTEISLTRSGAPFTLNLGLTPNPWRWVSVLLSVAYVLSGVFLLLRAPDWHLARRYFVTAWCFALPPVSFESPGGPAALSWEVSLAFVAYAVGSVSIIWTAQEFTLSARPVSALQRALALPVGVLFLLGYAGRYFSSSGRTPNELTLFAAVVWLAGATIAGLSRAYLRSDPLERRQIRWVVAGFYVAFAGAVCATVLGLEIVQNATGLPYENWPALQSGSALAIPLGVIISVVGYRWLDIDRVITAAASYTIIGVAVLGAAIALVPQGASAVAPALGVEPALAQWLLMMALVLAAVPAHLYLRPRIDRRLFAERHRRVAGLARLVDELGRCNNADELWQLASERIFALLEPDSLVAYARDGKLFVPRFASGCATAAPHGADSLLVRALERRGMPLASDASELDPFDRAALETLGVALVLPIGTHERLLGFACLGRKRTRDIYTREETAQLAAVALRCAQVLSPRDTGPSPLPNVFRREGEQWTVASQGKEIRLRDMRGLQYLAMLLREPGREFAALDMVRAASGIAPGARAEEPDLAVVRHLGDAGPALDAQARAEYRARLTELESELADAERCADLGRVERASAEREALLAELEASARGRAAPPGSDSERARVAVTKAIKTALDRIAEAHPELGAHLATAVRRGYVCAYQPDPRDAAEWEM